MDGGLKSVKSKRFTNSLPSCVLSFFSFLVSPCLPCFSSLFSHLLSLRSLSFLFILYSTEAETDARAASEERKKVERARARSREKECWSVRPCGFRMNRARTSVCVRERVTVSELVGEKKTERNERALCWLARGSAVRGVIGESATPVRSLECGIFINYIREMEPPLHPSFPPSTPPSFPSVPQRSSDLSGHRRNIC